MFRNVQLKVKQTIGQDPWLSFPSLPAVYSTGKSTGDDHLHEEQIETAFWEIAKTNGSAALLSAYIARFPKGTHVSVAQAMVQDFEHRQLEEAAQVARAEQAHEADRVAAEKAGKAQRRQDQAIKAQEHARSQLSADGKQLKEIQEQLKVAREATLKAEVQRLAALRAAEEARANAEKTLVRAATSSLARDIQIELKRVGCFAGDPDTSWTPRASEALARYLSATKQALPNEGLTPVYLQHLKGAPAHSCTSPCGSAEKLADGKCVAFAPQSPPVTQAVSKDSEACSECTRCRRLNNYGGENGILMER